MSTETFRVATFIFMAFGQTLFAGLYLTFPWWNNFLGRALFAKTLTLAVLLDFLVVAHLFGVENIDMALNVMYLALALAVWAQLVAFGKVRKDAPRVAREFYDSHSDPQRRFPETEHQHR